MHDGSLDRRIKNTEPYIIRFVDKTGEKFYQDYVVKLQIISLKQWNYSFLINYLLV